MAKVCLQVTSEEQLLELHKNAQGLGLESHLIRDSGKTEFGGIKTLTACAIGPDEAEAIDLAVEATRAVGLGICGVDLLPARGEILIGEVNPTPGFVSLERATGVDVARAIVDHLVALTR